MDYTASGTATIIRFDTSVQSSEVFVGSGLPIWAMAIAYDHANDRFLVGSDGYNSPLVAVDRTSAAVSTVVAATNGYINGIVMDNDSNWYVNCAIPGKIYRYDYAFANPPLMISEGLAHPTAPGFNPVDNILAVPNYDNNTVTFMDIGDDDGDSIPAIIDNCPDDYNPDQADGDSDGIGDACEACCGLYTGGYTGNADCSDNGKRNLSDITRAIDRVYVSRVDLCCEENGNTDGDEEGRINLSDITKLIDHVYVSRNELAACL
jgi:hypothetical protein